MVRSKEQNDKAAPSHAASVALSSTNPIKKVTIKKTLKDFIVSDNNISIMDGGNIESGDIKFSTLKKSIKGDNINGRKKVKSLLEESEITKRKNINIDNGNCTNINDQSNVVIVSAAGASAIPTTSIYAINTTTTTHNPSTLNRKRTTRKMDGQTTTGSNSSRSTTGLSGEESRNSENKQNIITEFGMVSIEDKWYVYIYIFFNNYLIIFFFLK